MKKVLSALLAFLTIAPLAFAGPPSVKFEVVYSRDGKVVATPTVTGDFGQTVTAEVEGQMKVVASAERPGFDGFSATTAKAYLFLNGEMKLVKEMSMRADLSRTPSFEYSPPGTGARFVIKPRLVKE